MNPETDEAATLERDNRRVLLHGRPFDLAVLKGYSSSLSTAWESAW